MLQVSSMFCFIFLSLVSSLFQFSHAGPTEILKNGHLAYYGADFYSSKPLTRNDLYLIVAGRHIHFNGGYDQITEQTNCGSDCYEQTKNEYQTAREILFGDLFKKQDHRGSFVEEVYCAKKFYFKDVSEISRMGNLVNIEHTWPQSKFSGRYDKFLQKGDLHHLFPSDSHANSTRGNYRFGDPTSRSTEEEVENCPASRVQDMAGQTEFTPPKDHKGNIARALFYFSIRYDLNISAEEEKVLRIWHKADPVDAAEKIRTNKIATYQKNRNPFVDFPQLVDQIKDF